MYKIPLNNLVQAVLNLTQRKHWNISAWYDSSKFRQRKSPCFILNYICPLLFVFRATTIQKTNTASIIYLRHETVDPSSSNGTQHRTVISLHTAPNSAKRASISAFGSGLNSAHHGKVKCSRCWWQRNR